jgi:hypothetical protein
LLKIEEEIYNGGGGIDGRMMDDGRWGLEWVLGSGSVTISERAYELQLQ